MRKLYLISVLISFFTSFVCAEPVDFNDEYHDLRVKWSEGFLGKQNVLFDKKLKNMVVITNNKAQEYWSSMNIDPSRHTLWNDIKLDDQTEDGKKVLGEKLRISFQRLFIMAKAYQLRDGKLQNNPIILESIIDGLQFLNKNYYKVGAEEWGNWWNWELGIPKDINNLLIILYDQLPLKLITSYIDTTRYFTPEPTHLGASSGSYVSSNSNYRVSTGGNRTDNTQVVLLRGILAKNRTEISSAITALSSVINYVDQRDGFYQDGSFLQHYDIAYNGTYGNVLLNGLGAQINLVLNTPWQINTNKLQNIYPLIFKNYAPFLYRGTMMEFVNGRAISRPKEQGHNVGHNILTSLIFYIDYAPSQYLYPLKQLIKTQISQDTYLDFFDSTNQIDNYQKAQQLMQDSTISIADNQTGFFLFPAMDRVIYRTDDWVFSLAMHSNRLGNFECMNKENRRGWFTGDGMGYIYTKQLDHYHNYWPVVDSYRLEGTTVDDQIMGECQGQRNKIKGGRNIQMDWVGSVKLADIGAAGMDFSNWDDTLTAKKSWFMFDSGIVMLGSNINSTIGAKVTTTVVNRKITDTDTTDVFVNGDVWKGHNNVTVKSLLLHDPKQVDSALGYVFFTPTKLNLLQQTRSGNWRDIGITNSEVSSRFITASIEQTRENNSYAYVIFPDTDIEHISTYAIKNPIDILRQDNIAHIINNLDEKIIAANVWEQTKVFISDNISVLSKMALMIKTEDNIEHISISDPLQTQMTLELEFNQPTKIIFDPEQRLQLSNKNELIVDVQDLKGRSYDFKVEFLSDKKLTVNQDNLGGGTMGWISLCGLFMGVFIRKNKQ